VNTVDVGGVVMRYLNVIQGALLVALRVDHQDVNDGVPLRIAFNAQGDVAANCSFVHVTSNHLIPCVKRQRTTSDQRDGVLISMYVSRSHAHTYLATYIRAFKHTRKHTSHKITTDGSTNLEEEPLVCRGRRDRALQAIMNTRGQHMN